MARTSSHFKSRCSRTRRSRRPPSRRSARAQAADRAWRTALDAEIGGYDNAEDEHFRARANDLRDICERVLSALSGEVTEPSVPSGAIVIGEDLTPSRFLATDWSARRGHRANARQRLRSCGDPRTSSRRSNDYRPRPRPWKHRRPGRSADRRRKCNLISRSDPHHPQIASRRVRRPRNGRANQRKSSECGPL